MEVDSGEDSMRLRSRLLLLLFLTTAASPARAAGFLKSYFSKTTEGASARYRLKDKISGGDSDYRCTRLPSEAGKERLEIRVEITSGEFKGTKSTSVYVLREGYSLEKDALSYGKAIAAMTTSNGDSDPYEIPASTLPLISESMIDYAAAVKFEAAEKLGGKACDRYSYSKRREGDPGSVESGMLWLDETIPFGIRRQEATIRETTGKTVSSYEMTFEESDAPEVKLPAATKPSGEAKAGSTAILEAYTKGEIQITVRVVDGSPNGESLMLVILNKTEVPLSLVVPKGKTVFEVGTPIGELNVVSEADRLVRIPPGETSEPVAVRQEGRKRALEGRFMISVYEGTPLFSGNVTVGFVKEK
jgi:hypothetical protein